MAKGGARPGAGRKTKTDEDKARDLAIQGIKNVCGSEEKAFEYLLKSGEPSLIKFAFEHAFGKPKERVDLSIPQTMTLKVIRGTTPAPE